MGNLNVIGREEILAAAETLRQYKQDKTALEQRIIAGEEWFRMRHGRAGVRRPTSRLGLAGQRCRRQARRRHGQLPRSGGAPGGGGRRRGGGD